MTGFTWAAFLGGFRWFLPGWHLQGCQGTRKQADVSQNRPPLAWMQAGVMVMDISPPEGAEGALGSLQRAVARKGPLLNLAPVIRIPNYRYY